MRSNSLQYASKWGLRGHCERNTPATFQGDGHERQPQDHQTDHHFFTFVLANRKRPLRVDYEAPNHQVLVYVKRLAICTQDGVFAMI